MSAAGTLPPPKMVTTSRLSTGRRPGVARSQAKLRALPGEAGVVGMVRSGVEGTRWSNGGEFGWVNG